MTYIAPTERLLAELKQYAKEAAHRAEEAKERADKAALAAAAFEDAIRRI